MVDTTLIRMSAIEEVEAAVKAYRAVQNDEAWNVMLSHVADALNEAREKTYPSEESVQGTGRDVLTIKEINGDDIDDDTLYDEQKDRNFD